jgi:hypothetical protein
MGRLQSVQTNGFRWSSFKAKCRNCGWLYQKHETKVEPELKAIKEPSTGQKGKVQRVGKNPSSELEEAATRDLNNKWEIKDSELIAELKSGSVLPAYS